MQVSPSPDYFSASVFFLPFLVQWSRSLNPEVRRCLRCSGVLGLALMYSQWSQGGLFFLQGAGLVTLLSFLEAAGVDLRPKEDFVLSLVFLSSFWYSQPMLLAICYCALRLLLQGVKVARRNAPSTVLGLVAVGACVGSGAAGLVQGGLAAQGLGALGLFSGAVCLQRSGLKPHSE